MEKRPWLPNLFYRQLEDGAWADHSSNGAPDAALSGNGEVKKVLMANQVVGQQNLRELCLELREDPEFDFYLLADSFENVDQLAEAAKNNGLSKPIQILVELGFPWRKDRLAEMVELAMEVAKRRQES